MHKLLHRQIRRFLGGQAGPPPEPWASLLAAVDAAYAQGDADRLMLERSMELTSEELTDANQRLREERKALVASEARFLAFMDNGPFVAWIKDGDGRFVYVNASYEKAFAPHGETVVGQTDADIFPADAAARHQAGDREVLASGRPLETEEELASVDGSVHSWFILKFPLKDASGRTAVGGTAVEISERRRLEQQLRQSQKMEAIGRLAGGVAHDFNNLLSVILGYADIALSELPGGHPVREYIEEMKKAGERAASLTRQLLAFSRRQVLQPRLLDLNAVVIDMERMVRRLIGENIELTTRLDPALRTVKADPGQMEQVILNLVVNARDAMPSGGKLLIRTANVEPDDIVSAAGERPIDRPAALVEVSDSGCGMTAEVMSHLFEPFFTTKEQGKGTGLGLSMVYGIVKQSDGHVSASSSPGAGSTFRIFLPCAERATRVVSAPAAQGRLNGHETILLVEDEAGLRSMIRRILEADGYTVLEAPGGPQALRTCARYDGKIDLILTDVIMPGMHGRELVLQAAEIRPQLRHMYMSGYIDDATVRACASDERVPFLQKPFSPAVLSSKIREALDAVS